MLVMAMVMALALLPATSHAQAVYITEEQPVAVQLHTNALYYAALSPNIGIEFQTNAGIALQFDYVGAWWNSTTKNRFFSNYAFQSELRYYLSHATHYEPFHGHHIGIYGQMLTYDFEFGSKGYQSDDLKRSWAVGVAYGFTKPLSRHFSLDLTAGVGYFTSRYTVYEPYEYGYYATGHKKLSFFGPTRLECSLIWNINLKNNK